MGVDDTSGRVRHGVRAVTCGLLLAWGVSAGAQSSSGTEPGDKSEPRPEQTMRASAFTVMDIDGDGYLTLDEIHDPVLRSQFQTLDKNHDGRLDRSEYSGIGR
jgi:hypothetical protein